jgi:tetratricopeptide (TPR) repeat protein
MEKAFSVAGYDIKFDEKFVKYNELNKRFEILGMEAECEFIETYQNTISTIDEVHEKGLELGYSFITKHIHEAVSILISHDIFHIDKSSFFNDYLKEYLDWEEDFEQVDKRYRDIVFSAEEEKMYREERKAGRSQWRGGGFGLGAAIQASIKADAMNVATGLAHSVFNSVANKMTDAVTVEEKAKLFSDDSVLEDLAFSVNNNVYKIHYAIVDALIDNHIEIELYVTDENIRKSSTLTNNMKTGLIPKEKEEMLIKQIIYSNPYNDDIYLYLLSKYGDENQGIQQICTFLNLNIEDELQLFLKNYFESLPKHTEEATKESIINFESYAQKMGVTNTVSYANEFNKILDQHDLNIRTVDGIIFDTREEAHSANIEYEKVAVLLNTTDFKSEESVLSALDELRCFNTKIGCKYLDIFNERLLSAIKYQDQSHLDNKFPLNKIVNEEMADTAISLLEKTQSRNMIQVEKRLQEIKEKRIMLIENTDKRTLDDYYNTMVILSDHDIDREINSIRNLNIRTTKLSEDLLNNINVNREDFIKKHNILLDKAIKYEARIRKVKKEMHEEKKGALGSITKAIKNGSDIIDSTQEKREKEGWDFITLNGTSPDRVELLSKRRQGMKISGTESPVKLNDGTIATNSYPLLNESLLTHENLTKAEQTLSIPESGSQLNQIPFKKDKDNQPNLDGSISNDPHLIIKDNNLEKSRKGIGTQSLPEAAKNKGRKKLFLLLACMILIIGTAFASQKYTQIQSYKSLVKIADQHLSEGRYLEAVSSYEESLKYAENDDVINNIKKARLLIEAQSHFDEGVSLLSSKDYLAAIEQFELISQIDHEIFDASQEKIGQCKDAFIKENILLANNSITASNYEEATRYIDELMKLDPNNVETNTLKTNMERRIQEEEDRVAAEKAEAEKANRLTYTKYHNSRYGFTITYPNHLIMGEPSTNGDGQTFLGPDGSSLTVFGTNNILDETAYSLYDNLLQSVGDVSYSEQLDNWYAVIGYDHDSMIYKRGVVGRGSINTLIFSYPPELYSKYTEFLKNMNIYFETPNLDESH